MEDIVSKTYFFFRKLLATLKPILIKLINFVYIYSLF